MLIQSYYVLVCCVLEHNLLYLCLLLIFDFYLLLICTMLWLFCCE